MFTNKERSATGPIWALRLMAVVATLCVGLSMLVKGDTPRSFFSGMAFGVLIGLCAYILSLKGVVERDTPQPSDVNRYPLT